jgi:hypothetical protein
MHPLTNHLFALSRRSLFQRVGTGIGSVALASLLAKDSPADVADPLTPQRTHFAPRAKNVIFLHMVGAPSQLDLFDYKPELQRLDGDLVPDHLWEGLRLAFIRKQPALLGTQFKFSRHGESGIELSEMLPYLAASRMSCA